MIVVITDEAEADLERIGDFIARDNPVRAISFVAEMVSRCERLADAPRSFLSCRVMSIRAFAGDPTVNI